MKVMVRERRLGLVMVFSENFCQTCLPYPKEVLSKVTTHPPILAFRRNEDLLTIIKASQESQEL